MNSPEIVESNVFPEACPKFPDAVKGVKGKPFVLDVSPEAFCEDVVERAPASVHAYGHAMRLEHPSEGL